MDLLVEGRHFRRGWSSAFDIGGKAAAQNLADVAAMGASPTALLVGFATPGDLAVAWAEDLARGIAEECARAGAHVAGGDVSSADSVMIAITALGDLGGREPVTRGGARPGDRLAVAGGWAARPPAWRSSRPGSRKPGSRKPGSAGPGPGWPGPGRPEPGIGASLPGWLVLWPATGGRGRRIRAGPRRRTSAPPR